MMIIRIASWVARIAGALALLLGGLFWLAELGIVNTPFVFDPVYIDLHMLTGILVTLALLVLAIALVVRGRARAIGVVSVVYALIVPIFGELQLRLYVDSAPWLVPTIHMLIGVGAIGLAQNLAGRLGRLDPPTSRSAALEGVGVPSTTR